MSDAIVSVEFAGPLVSFQDGGRPGFMRFGVAHSGAMDRNAFAAANAALGNPPGATAIEISLGGLVLRCQRGSVSFAIAGGGFAVEHAGRSGSSWQVATLRAGETLSIRPGRWGSWTYLAFAGEIAARRWLGSTATHSTSGLGGGKLSAGDEIVIVNAQCRDDRVGAIARPVFARPRHEVHVVLGPQERFFSAQVIEAFLGQRFRLTSAYDRMGVRLAGPPLAPRAPLDMPSEPIQRGSVQVAGDGVATVLLADHQTTGGYPKIATVIGSDLDAFAQLRPHDEIRFRALEPEDAICLTRRRAGIVARYLEAVSTGPVA